MISAVPITCVILAGGLGTRLRSVVADKPKCLAPVGGRSFLDIQIDTLAHAGVNAVVLSLGYLAEQVVAAMDASKPAVPLRHVIERDLLGTGGAAAHVLDTLGLDEVLVANGDTHLDGDLSAMLAPLARDEGELFRMAVVSVPDRARFGGVETNSAGRVTGFLDKGHASSGLINAGLYRLCRAALPPAGQGAYSLESSVLPALVQRGQVSYSLIAGEFIDIGVPADYQRFCALHSTT
jgi:D-glycero-alpha-D-manno-heptose 1-phosphate guanylyltransferase